jgi:hypothetical protein
MTWIIFAARLCARLSDRGVCGPRERHIDVAARGATARLLVFHDGQLRWFGVPANLSGNGFRPDDLFRHGRPCRAERYRGRAHHSVDGLFSAQIWFAA